MQGAVEHKAAGNTSASSRPEAFQLDNPSELDIGLSEECVSANTGFLKSDSEFYDTLLSSSSESAEEVATSGEAETSGEVFDSSSAAPAGEQNGFVPREQEVDSDASGCLTLCQPASVLPRYARRF